MTGGFYPAVCPNLAAPLLFFTPSPRLPVRSPMKSTSCPRLLLLLALVFFASGASCLHAQTRTVASFAAWGKASYFILDDGALYVANDYPYTSSASNYPIKITTGVKSVFPGDNRCFYLKTDDSLWSHRFKL